MTNCSAIAPGVTLSGGLLVETQLGRGGLAEVWRATSAAGTQVALKIPRQDLPIGAGVDELIRREHRLLSRLSHPHVVRALDCIDAAGRPALIMEYLDGGDLVPLLGADPRHWLRAARDVADALVSLHGNGVIHRDLKSRNVLFDRAGVARLVDFGLAADGARGAPSGGGTAAYARPDRPNGAIPDRADDTYAFAVLLYELLTGQLPFGVHPAPDALLRQLPTAIELTVSDPQASALAELVQATLSVSQESAFGGVRPFLDALESMFQRYQ